MAYEQHFLVSRVDETLDGNSGPIVVNTTNQREYINPGAKILVETRDVSGTDPTLTIFLTKTLVTPSGTSIDFRISSIFTPITASNLFSFDIDNVPDILTFNWVIGGTNTPTFTFDAFLTR